MPCIDCLQNCDKIVPDQCVMYTGPSIPLLGICQGDQLSIYEASVANALLTALDGTGIVPANVTLENCPFLLTQLGLLPFNLNNLLQILINSDCSFNDLITSLQSQITTMQSAAFDTGCLTLPVTPTRDQILQALVTQYCGTAATVALFPSTYVQLTDLTSLITPIVNNIITQSQTSGGSPQQFAKMVPFVAYEYYGPMSNFDATGKGLTPAGFMNVYVCNGANSTPDKRGRVTVGAVRNVPGGGSFDPAVDPANPANPNWSLLDTNGENTHILNVNEIPPHPHSITDPGHVHVIQGLQKGAGDGSNVVGSQAGSLTKQTNSATTGIIINPTGGGLGHNNIQPSIAANYIMYIP